MGFFEKIFGNKEVVEVTSEIPEKIEIDLSETAAWFESEISGFLAKVDTEAQRFIRQMTTISEKLNENLDMLERAESDDEIGHRMRNFAYDNKASFVNKVRAFNAKIIFSDAKGTLGFYDFFSMVANDINRLTGETARNIHLAKMLFAEDVKEITSGLNDMADVAQESLKVLIEYKDKSDMVTEIRVLLQEIESVSEMHEKEKRSLVQKRQSIETLHGEKKKADKILKGLETGEEASRSKQILEQKEVLDTDISKIRSDIFHAFSPLAKVLKKYERFSTGLTPDDEKILAVYIESPVKAIVLDKGFKTLSRIIENTEMLIDSGKIDLKDKQKQKVLSRLAKLKDTSVLGREVTEYNRLHGQLINIETMLDSMGVNKEIETARQKLKDIEDGIISVGQDVSRIEKERDVTNKSVSLKITELETVLSKMLDKDVSVRAV